MLMIRVDETIVINRPREDVWDHITDYAFDHRWRSGLLSMTPTPPGPAAPGSRVVEELRRGGQTYQATTAVDHLEPGQWYSFNGEGSGGKISGRRSVAPGSEAGTSRFTYAFVLAPTGLARLVGPLATWIARRGMRIDLRTLKAELERHHSRPAR